MKKLAVLFLLLLAGVACSSPREESQKDPALVGYNLIDEGRADAAIDHFQVLVDENPDSVTYRRGLSSAYALRGGFRVQNLVKPMLEIRQADQMKREFENLFKQVAESKSALKPFEKTLAFQIELLVFLKKFEAIPVLTDKQALDLRTAISVLLELKKPAQGDYLYMAVLEALLLKKELSKSLKAYTCEDAIGAVQTRIQASASHYGKIVFLLMRAQPSHSENYLKQENDLDHVVAETSLLTTSSLMTLSLVQYVSEPGAETRIFAAPPQCRL